MTRAARNRTMWVVAGALAWFALVIAYHRGNEIGRAAVTAAVLGVVVWLFATWVAYRQAIRRRLEANDAP